MNRDIEISPEELEDIEHFLKDAMSPAERHAFEQRLASESKLRQQVAAMRLLLIGIQESVLEEELVGFHKIMPASNLQTSVGKSPIISKWLMVAAAVIIVAAGTWLLFKPFDKEERLYSEYYKPDPGLITAMSTSDNYTFDKAMIDYKTANYDSALKAWEHLLVTKPGNDTLNYFIGSSLLAIGESGKAITYLQKVTEVEGSYFLSDANWYIGMALLKEGKKSEAIEFIKRSAHDQKDPLLNELNR